MRFFSIDREEEIRSLVKGSRFFARSFRIDSREDAERRLTDLRKRFHDATHHCFAWILSENRGGEFRYSDDGEPSGTAGKPISDMISKHGLVNVLVVVTRYFGGTKLGSGGLVRAYSEAADLVLKNSGVVEIEEGVEVTFTFSYDLQGYIEKELRAITVIHREMHYTENVELTVQVHEEDADPLIARISDGSQGQVRGEKMDGSSG